MPPPQQLRDLLWGGQSAASADLVPASHHQLPTLESSHSSTAPPTLGHSAKLTAVLWALGERTLCCGEPQTNPGALASCIPWLWTVSRSQANPNKLILENTLLGPCQHQKKTRSKVSETTMQPSRRFTTNECNKLPQHVKQKVCQPLYRPHEEGGTSEPVLSLCSSGFSSHCLKCVYGLSCISELKFKSLILILHLVLLPSFTC